MGSLTRPQIDDIIGRILEREGGYVNRAEDRGGPTKYGVTLTTLASWRGRAVRAADVEAMGEAEAREIYRHRYIVGPGFDRLMPAELAELAIDCAVNHGTTRAIRWVRRAVGVPEATTGEVVVPPTVTAALAYSDPRQAFNVLLAQRIRFYGELITRSPSQAIFARGWMNRASEFLLRAPRCQAPGISAA